MASSYMAAFSDEVLFHKFIHGKTAAEQFTVSDHSFILTKRPIVWSFLTNNHPIRRIISPSKMTSLFLLPVQWFLFALDFTVMLLSFGWVNAVKKLLSRRRLRTVPVGDDPSHRVHIRYKDKLLETPFEGVTTIYDLQCRSFHRYSSVKCMGTRAYLGQLDKKLKKFGDVKWRTYSEVGVAACAFGAALRGVGLVPSTEQASLNQHSTPCSLAIFENTCAEWMIAALGAFSQSIIVTTVYATLGMEAVIDAIKDGVISAVLCNKRSVELLLSRAKDMPTLKTIIYTNDLIVPGEDIPVRDGACGIEVVSFENFVAWGKITQFPPTPPSPNSTGVIMYTSGSTGKPKGVVITHKNLLSTVASLKESFGVREFDVALGYLPLAHIMELVSELTYISMGCTICYADPKTLTTAGAYPIGALEQYSPTIMIGVPKVWDVVKKGIEAKINALPLVSRFLAKTAFKARSFALYHGYDTPLFKALVFRKFAKVSGGKLRLALSGGGPLNREVQAFISTAFGCPLFQGYGLTETTAGLAVQDPVDTRYGIAGCPVPSVEVRLESNPDVNDRDGRPYLTSDRLDVDGNPVYGRGEILVKGHTVAVGYYMMPEKTNEEGLGEGNWFHTGDIGQFMLDGSILIVDRKKNLVKLKGGEYIAVEAMDATYGNSKFVDTLLGGICCYGDGDMDRPVALMQLSRTATMEWAKTNDIIYDFEKTLKSEELVEAVMSDLHNQWKKGGLSHLEKIVAVALLTEPWTPENGCLTAANKVQRRAVISAFQKEFEQIKQKGIC